MTRKECIQERLQLIDRAKDLVSECNDLGSAFFKAETVEEQKEIMYTYIRKREELREIHKTIGDKKANDAGADL